jgi:hypothetical protein
MKKNQISITRALNELKLLDQRINKSISNNIFVGVKLKDKSLEKDFNPSSSLQSIKDLINRKQLIKSAIMLSNSKTIVEIGKEKISVVEAIEKKSTIVYKEELLKKLKKDYQVAITKEAKINIDVDNAVNRILESTLGKEKVNASNDLIESISKPYRESNQASLDDPLKISEIIKDLEEEIDTFNSEIDFVLSESNAITKIELVD